MPNKIPMITYSFRDPEKSYQLSALHPALIRMFYLLSHFINELGFKVEITSMVRPANTIPGESGVHATGRALDFVPIETPKSGPVTVREMSEIADVFNRYFPRDDKKLMFMYHAVDGGNGYHFHIQIPQTKDYLDLKGVVPKD